MIKGPETARPELWVWIQQKVRKKSFRSRCRRLCACAREDQGGSERAWRPLDVGFATPTLISVTRWVKCPTQGVTVARVPWAPHDSSFANDFPDLVVDDAIASSKTTVARLHPV
jgi:hypothetical protein